MSRAKSPALRLTTDANASADLVRPVSRHIAERDPFKLERRRDLRSGAAGSVVVVVRDVEERVSIMSLDLVDRSSGGLGATSPLALEPGSHVTLCPQGTPHVWISARAVRCIAQADGTYHLGLQYAHSTAA